MSAKQLFLTAFVLLATSTTLIMSAPQRPSFAGSRPSDGLNQKDKYHQQVFDNSNNSVVGIADRFGTIESNRLPSNASQRPPIGVDIVTPLPVYIPLPVRTQINFDNRIGGTDQNQSSTVPPVLPFDALGDRVLYDQLSALPEHQRPFWFLNYQAIQSHRNGTAPFAGSIASRGSFFG